MHISDKLRKSKYDPSLASEMSKDDLAMFFWGRAWLNPEEVPHNFWQQLYKRSENLGFVGYQSLCHFFRTGEIKSFARTRTIEEKLEEAKKEHFSHGSQSQFYESILKNGLLCDRYLKTREIKSRSQWGRFMGRVPTRSDNFVFMYKNLGVCEGNSPGGDLTLCISPELNNEAFDYGDEVIYPGIITPNDIISINMGDSITKGFFGEIPSYLHPRELWLERQKDEQEKLKHMVDLQKKYFENAKKYGIPIIADGKVILLP